MEEALQTLCFSEALPASKPIVISFVKVTRFAAYSYHIAVLFPADPEGGGFFTLCGHGYPFPAASGGHLGLAFSVQLKPASCHGSRARGATHRLVQPLCPSPLLWQDGRQLRRHAHEHDSTQGEIF